MVASKLTADQLRSEARSAKDRMYRAKAEARAAFKGVRVDNQGVITSEYAAHLRDGRVRVRKAQNAARDRQRAMVARVETDIQNTKPSAMTLADLNRFHGAAPRAWRDKKIRPVASVPVGEARDALRRKRKLEAAKKRKREQTVFGMRTARSTAHADTQRIGKATRGARSAGFMRNGVWVENFKVGRRAEREDLGQLRTRATAAARMRLVERTEKAVKVDVEEPPVTSAFEVPEGFVPKTTPEAMPDSLTEMQRVAWMEEHFYGI